MPKIKKDTGTSLIRQGDIGIAKLETKVDELENRLEFKINCAEERAVIELDKLRRENEKLIKKIRLNTAGIICLGTAVLLLVAIQVL